MFSFSAKTGGKKNYISERRYLLNPHLKLDSLDTERKQAGKSLNELVMDLLTLSSLHGLGFFLKKNIPPWEIIVTSFE